MAEDKRESSQPTKLGTVHIADEVVAIIAGLATTEVGGVASMSGGIARDIAVALGRKNLSQGIKVDLEGERAAIDIYVILKYGLRIPDVAWAIQENVKKAVANMTGLKTKRINVNVQGISFPDSIEKSEKVK